MFRYIYGFAPATFLCLLSGCGGGGGDSTTTPATTLTAPPVGQTVDYAVTDTDNSNNTIHWTLEYKVLSSSPDASFTQSVIGNGTATVNGTTYGTVNQVDQYNSSHELLGYTVENATPIVCTYAAPFPRPPTSAPGVAWPSVVDEISCSDAHQYQVTRDDGSQIDIESVTVPAGTFNATKLQYQYISAGPDPSEIVTEEITAWSDTVSGRTVQVSTDYSYAGFTSTSGHRVHELRQLLTAP